MVPQGSWMWVSFHDTQAPVTLKLRSPSGVFLFMSVAGSSSCPGLSVSLTHQCYKPDFTVPPRLSPSRVKEGRTFLDDIATVLCETLGNSHTGNEGTPTQ
jgi:hypothetical protein